MLFNGVEVVVEEDWFIPWFFGPEDSNKLSVCKLEDDKYGIVESATGCVKKQDTYYIDKVS